MTWSLEVRTLVGSRLRNLRKQRGVSCAYVAEQVLGYPRRTHVAVSRLERGILLKPDRETLEALASFYGVGLSEVLPPEVLKDLREPTNSLAGRKELQRLEVAKRCAQHVAQLRRFLNMTPEAMASALQARGAPATPHNVLDWEVANCMPSDEQAEALASLAHSTTDWLFFGKAA